LLYMFNDATTYNKERVDDDSAPVGNSHQSQYREQMTTKNWHKTRGIRQDC
jgi:hypothetical protein